MIHKNWAELIKPTQLAVKPGADATRSATVVAEPLERGFGLPFPGPVIGMALLIPALQWPAVRRPVSQAAHFLLSHLSLLFVPVGVGVITHLDILRDHGLRLLLVIVLFAPGGLIGLIAGKERHHD